MKTARLSLGFCMAATANAMIEVPLVRREVPHGSFARSTNPVSMVAAVDNEAGGV